MRKQVKTIDTIQMEQGRRLNRNNFILFIEGSLPNGEAREEIDIIELRFVC